MKINKLLFFLLAVFSLNSCVEYVDNGTKPDGPEQPEEQKFTAEHSNAEEAKYVGDVFKFTAMLNSVDVTSTTKFKVNGTDIKGSTYTPHKTGSHSVIATMDNFTANFKFTVLEKEEEPEPTGNRIEYGGKSYPVSITQWVVNVNAKNELLSYNNNGTTCTLWAMISVELDSNEDVVNQFLTFALVPIKNPTTPAFPNEAPSPLTYAPIPGVVTINGNDVFDITGTTYSFGSTGNSPAQDIFTAPQPWTGTANYTITATGANSGNSAQLFWNGSYEAFTETIAAKSAQKAQKVFSLPNFKSVSKGDLKALKIAK